MRLLVRFYFGKEGYLRKQVGGHKQSKKTVLPYYIGRVNMNLKGINWK